VRAQVSPLAIAGIVVGAVIAFVAMWLVLSAFLAWISGWRKLAVRFQTAPETAASRLRLPTAKMRFGVTY